MLVTVSIRHAERLTERRKPKSAANSLVPSTGTLSVEPDTADIDEPEHSSLPVHNDRNRAERETHLG
jgi:hypothetical protein